MAFNQRGKSMKSKSNGNGAAPNDFYILRKEHSPMSEYTFYLCLFIVHLCIFLRWSAVDINQCFLWLCKCDKSLFSNCWRNSICSYCTTELNIWSKPKKPLLNSININFNAFLCALVFFFGAINKLSFLNNYIAFVAANWMTPSSNGRQRKLSDWNALNEYFLKWMYYFKFSRLCIAYCQTFALLIQFANNPVQFSKLSRRAFNKIDW